MDKHLPPALNGETETLALGRHVLIEYYGCDAAILNDGDRIRELMLEAASRSRATIVTDVFHRFNPHGISGVVVIAESHIAIHTWPEHRCASVDIFSCNKDWELHVIQGFLAEGFGAATTTSNEILRGRVSNQG